MPGGIDSPPGNGPRFASQRRPISTRRDIVNLRSTRPARWLAAFALLASLITAMAGTYGSAEAAFPGANGKIAFMSDRDGNTEVYVMNAAGTTHWTRTAG